MFELVRCDDAVPELMAGLVDGDVLGILGVRWHQPARARGDQGGVLHPVSTALPRRIDNREVIVRIRTEPFAVILQGRARGFEMTIRLTLVLRLKQEPHLDARE